MDNKLNIDYQDIHNKLTERKKQLEINLRLIKTSIESNKEAAFANAGLLMKGQKFVEDEDVVLDVYYRRYYDRYVSERGAMWNAGCSVKIRTLKEYQDILEKVDSRKFRVDEYGHTDDDFYANHVRTDDGLKYVYDGAEDQGTVTAVGVLYKVMKRSEAEKIGSHSKSWEFVDDMEFEYHKLWTKTEKLLKIEI